MSRRGLEEKSHELLFYLELTESLLFPYCLCIKKERKAKLGWYSYKRIMFP